jgi:hypothetical protein
LVARVVWDDEAAGSSPVSPTSGYGIVAIIPPFQGGDTGSTPVTRSMVTIAQVVRAPVCGTGGRGFKSH